MSYFSPGKPQEKNIESNKKNKLYLKDSLFKHIETLKSKTSKSKIFSKIQEQKTEDKALNQNNQDL